jgi:23S rRNA (cytidine1920-2'-O)/16S rRNA (cytidine1409-2'-O)-methyltransferase
MAEADKNKKQRLDVLLAERGLAESRQKAQALILAGKVQVEGKRAEKAGALFSSDVSIQVESGQRYVSRGGEKLEGALTDFGIDCKRRICLDIGSSTGGFADCLLQHGAAQVIAVDVNTSQLDWKLQNDARVFPVQANARYLEPSTISGSAYHSERSEESLNDLSRPPQPTLVTMDLSFISTAKVLPQIVPLAAAGTDFLILVKPQFELRREDVGRGGIVRDPALHQRAIENVSESARALGLQILGVKPSHLAGAQGNQEFFLWARNT